VDVGPDDRGRLDGIRPPQDLGAHALLDAVDEELERGRRSRGRDRGAEALRTAHEHDPIIERVFQGEAQVLQGGGDQALPRSRLGERAHQVGAEGAEARAAHLTEERLLAVEVPVDGGRRNLGATRDLAERELHEPLLEVQVTRLAQQAGACLFAVRRHVNSVNLAPANRQGTLVLL
jgi:hypothetical protein